MLPMLTTSGDLVGPSRSFSEVVIDVIGSGDGPAGRIDPDDDRFDTFGSCRIAINLPFNEPVTFQDHAADGQDRYLVASPRLNPE